MEISWQVEIISWKQIEFKLKPKTYVLAQTETTLFEYKQLYVQPCNNTVKRGSLFSFICVQV